MKLNGLKELKLTNLRTRSLKQLNVKLYEHASFAVRECWVVVTVAVEFLDAIEYRVCAPFAAMWVDLDLEAPPNR